MIRRAMREESERRYERKLRVTGAERAWVEILIQHHPSHLIEVHPPRYINNLYLDTFRRQD